MLTYLLRYMHSGSKAADSEIPIAGKDGDARTVHP